MTVIDTNAQPTPDEPGDKDGGAAGTETGKAGAASSERTFTQAELNSIVQRRLADQERTLTAKFKEELAAQLEATRNETLADLEKQVEERVSKKAAELQLDSTRAEIQKARGLTDKQVTRLQGATPEELLADAVDVFGELPTAEEAAPGTEEQEPAGDAAAKPARKPAPRLPTARGGQGSGLDIKKMSPAEIRKHANDLWPK